MDKTPRQPTEREQKAIDEMASFKTRLTVTLGWTNNGPATLLQLSDEGFQDMSPWEIAAMLAAGRVALLNAVEHVGVEGLPPPQNMRAMIAVMDFRNMFEHANEVNGVVRLEDLNGQAEVQSGECPPDGG